MADVDRLGGARVLVTGVAGFLGANVARELLRRGADLHGMLRPGSDRWRIGSLRGLVPHQADVTDRDAVERTVLRVKPRFCVHLAAPGGQLATEGDRERMMRACVVGTENLLRACRRAGVRRFVHVCSATAYRSARRPLHEDDELTPPSFRGQAKAAAARICSAAIDTGQPIVILRPFMIYGPWQAGDRLLPTTFAAALHGRPMALTQPGIRHDWVHAADVARGCVRALASRKSEGETINLGSGKHYTNEQIVDLVEAATGRPVERRTGAFPARPTDRCYWRADVEKAEWLLGWRPDSDLRTGIAATVDWFRRHQRFYRQAS